MKTRPASVASLLLPLALALLTIAPAAAQGPVSLDEVTFTAAPDVPLTLQVVEQDAGLASATIEPSEVSPGTLESRLTELFGATLGYRADEEAGTLLVAGAPHAVEAAVLLVPELDRRARQVHFEVVLLRPTRKGSKRGTVQEWLDRGAWSMEMAAQASEAGLIEVVSSPSVTTVLDRSATVREGTCTPMEGEVTPDPRCPAGARYAGYELSLVPRQVGDLLVVETTFVRRDWQERDVSSELLMLDVREAVVLVLEDEDEPDYLFVTAKIVE